jgi:hypothetical protein
MRLAILTTHLIQYYSPWFRHLAEGRKPKSRNEQAGSGRIDDSGLGGLLKAKPMWAIALEMHTELMRVREEEPEKLGSLLRNTVI